MLSSSSLLNHLFILCLLPGLVFSQDEDISEENYLGAPDTIVFFSEEDVVFTEEYLMIHFTAVDEEGNFPVPARFKIFNRANNKLLSGASESKHQYQASLLSNEEYIIEVNASGYLSYNEYFSLQPQKEKKHLKKIIPLEKSNFIVNLKAINGITGDVVKNASITLINTTSSKTIHTLVNPETGECKADFDLKSAYKVEVNALGYLPYYEDYDTNEKLEDKEFILLPNPFQSKLKIHVVDADTEIPIHAQVSVIDAENTELPLKFKKELIETVINLDKKYSITAEAVGYAAYQQSMAFNPGQESSITIKLEALGQHIEKPEEISLVSEVYEGVPSFENIELGKAMVLDNIIFEQSKYILQEDSYKELDKLVKTLKENPKYSIVIAGHTDNQGDKKLNQMLSLNRAKVIANYLIENGIDVDRLTVRGHGSAFPIAPNDSEENRKKNRRVEFTIK